MAGLINIGFGNVVNTDKLIAVVNPDAAPVKRMVQGARETQQLIDASQGRKTKAVLIMENGMIVLSALQVDTITRRFSSYYMEAGAKPGAMTEGAEKGAGHE